jgi:hypothetical protein
MSRGPGKLQSRLLEILATTEDQPLDTFLLAAGIYKPEPDPQGRILLTTAQIKAVHRALRSLLKAGKIEEFGHNSKGRMQWRRLGARARDTDKALAEIEAEVAAGKPQAKFQAKFLAAMLNHTSARDMAGVLGISKSTVLRDRRGSNPNKG